MEEILKEGSCESRLEQFSSQAVQRGAVGGAKSKGGTKTQTERTDAGKGHSIVDSNKFSVELPEGVGIG